MTRKTSLIPTEGILTKEGLQPASYNIDSYVSMMESVAHGAKGAAGMGSPTANRMKARAAEEKYRWWRRLLVKHPGLAGALSVNRLQPRCLMDSISSLTNRKTM